MSNRTTIIFICNGKSCKKDGAMEILRELEVQLNKKIPLKTKYCFGKCGNGPIMVILPQEIWYDHIQPQRVSLILETLDIY